MSVRRRDLVLGSGATLFLAAVPGCERLTVLDPRGDETIDPITSNEDFYTYACCGPPEMLERDEWVCAIRHGNTDLATLDASVLDGLEIRDREHTLQCIGGNPRAQLISNAVWGGLPLPEVLDALGVEVPASAVGMRLVGYDDYDAGIPIEALTDGPMWLVWVMNGVPLPFLHGAPARLLVPGHYGVKNLKWLREIAFVDTPHESYWTEFNWSESAEYLPNGYIATPADGVTILDTGDPVRVLGTAFAGRDPVTLVEVRLDDGPWEEADLDYAPGADIWALWSFQWKPTEGEHTLQVRVTTESGDMSVEDPAGTDPFIGYDGSMQIGVTVRS